MIIINPMDKAMFFMFFATNLTLYIIYIYIYMYIIYIYIYTLKYINIYII
jgi:hypothetical protein